MMDSTDIKKIAKRILKHQKGLHDIQIMHPAREWFLGVFVAIIILVASASWGLVTYLDNKEVTVDQNIGTQNNTQVYKEDLVKAALLEFERKKQIREANTIVVAPVIEENISTTTEEVVESEEEAEAEASQ